MNDIKKMIEKEINDYTNKYATKHKVSIEEAEYFANKYNIKFFEASPKDGTNVNELFYYLANEIYHDNNSVESNENNKVTLTKKKDNFLPFLNHL